MSVRRPWLSPLVPVYAAALAVKKSLRRLRPHRARELQWPVLSVGSLSAGGAGKTPVVIALAKLLGDREWDVDVLSRGYGRAGRRVEQVQPEIPGAAQWFGDEPTMIAQRTGVPVWVGADRAAAGRMAERERQRLPSRPADSPKTPDCADETASSRRCVHLLDDGFQHQRLARAMDVVLVTAEDLDDTLLPAGNLREPVTALARADVVVVRGEEFQIVGRRVWAHMREGAQMWTVRRSLGFPPPLFVFGAGLRPVAFCAIARPEGFAAMLAEEGCGVIETVAFGDHHCYTSTDIEHILQIAEALEASGFVTTEKDAVKLTSAMRESLASVGPLMIVALEAEFMDTHAVMLNVEARIS